MSLLDVKELRASYGAVKVLHGIDFHVDEGETVVILGANGAGKTTTLRAICGMIDTCLLYTSPSPRDATLSRMPSSA